MSRTAPWMILAVSCSVMPGLALASWGSSSSSSDTSSRRDERGKKRDGDKNGGSDRGRGRDSNHGNGGGGGVAVGHGGGNPGGGNAHQADPPGDGHRGRGRGHTEHGNGHGYGHDHDDDGHPATGGGPGHGGGRDPRDGRDDDDGDYVVVTPEPVYVGPRWGWAWGWGGWGGYPEGRYREDELRSERHEHFVRVRLLGEASGATSYSQATTQGSVMGSLRVEGPRWGVVLDGRSVVDSTVMELGPRRLGLGSAHLTYALFSSEEGGRLRLEAGAASLFAPGMIATGPSLGLSAELPLFLGLGLEGAVHGTAFPFVSATWSAGAYARLGAVSLHAGARRLFIDPTSAGTGPYVALALTFG